MKEKIILIFLLLLFVNEVHAISIAPSTFDIEFQPGKVINLTFSVANKDKDDKLTMHVGVLGELNESFKIIGEDSDILDPLERRNFMAELTLPDYLSPGTHKAFFTAFEGASNITNIQGVSATANVQTIVIVRVPYPGKYIDAEVIANDAEPNGKVEFDIDVISRGEEDINELYGIINIYDFDSNEVDTIQTDTINLESNGQRHIVKYWDVGNVSLGDYKVMINILYDGESREFPTSFRIGDIYIELLNVTTDTIVKDGIEKVGVIARNYWTRDINNAYLELTLKNNIGEVLQTVKSENINFKQWETKEVNVFVDTRTLNVGSYNSNFKIYYEGKENELNFVLNIIKKNFYENKLLITLLGVVIVLILIMLFMMYKLKTNKNVKKK